MSFLFSSGHLVAFLFAVLLALCASALQPHAYVLNQSSPVSGRQDKHNGFTLRHIFVHDKEGSNNTLLVQNRYPRLAVYTGNHNGNREVLRPLRLRSRHSQIYRLAHSQSLVSNHIPPQLPHTEPESDISSQEWRLENVSEPDVSDKETVLSLAKMSSDAYVLNETAPDWLNYSSRFNHSSNFGWKDNRLRGHVFADAENSTVIIAIKGTSAAPGDDTVDNDKLNDNLLFSCCCASQRTVLGPVCNCQADTFLCDQACLTNELRRPDRYYQLAVEIYRNVTKMYPESAIWLTGHSLGGSLSSLLGLTFGRPAVTFEAAPAALAAYRLGLPLPPGVLSHQERNYTGIYQFGNTADPVYMGACNGITSACYWSGYAMDSQCFTGLRCVYDTVGDKGWRLSLLSHRINNVIKDVIEAYDETAKCEPDLDCVDCNNWYFKEEND